MQADLTIDAKTLRMLCIRAAEKMARESNSVVESNWRYAILLGAASQALAALSEEIVIYLGEQVIDGEVGGADAG